MQRIYTDSEFAAVLEAGHAIVFIGIAWSGQSTLSSSVIREWERTSNAWGIDCPVYNVMPDKLLSVALDERSRTRAQGRRRVWLADLASVRVDR